MRLKIYRAASMAEAMTRLRAELGADALILSARTFKDGVELTAGLDPEPPAPAPPLPGTAVVWPGVQSAALRTVDRRPPAPGGRLAPMPALLAHHGVPAALAQQLARGALTDTLPRILRFAPIAAESGPLLFVGPPGAGKTSTVARLATRLVLSGERPMVITADGRRAGATEQLAAYTRLLSINLVVATHPDTIARAMTRREPGAAALIDAPGTDCRDPVQMQELTALAAAVGARIALVLPAGLDGEEAAETAASYRDIGATLLVATRLDLARRLGSVLGAAAAGDLGLAEAGIGSGAADGLVPLTAALLAERMHRSQPQPRRYPQPNEAPA